MMGVLGSYIDRGWFYTRLVSGVVGGEWITAGTGEDLVLAVETSSKLFFRVAF